MKPFILISLLAVGIGTAGTLHAQAPPQSYGGYYQRNAVQGTRTNVGSFLYDKYFYRQPSVSPYVNLSRRDAMGGDSYSTFVRPEQERRQQDQASMRSYVQQRKMAGNVGHTVYSNALGQTSRRAPPRPPATPTVNPYYSQWYGGRR